MSLNNKLPVTVFPVIGETAIGKTYLFRDRINWRILLYDVVPKGTDSLFPESHLIRCCIRKSGIITVEYVHIVDLLTIVFYLCSVKGCILTLFCNSQNISWFRCCVCNAYAFKGLYNYQIQTSSFYGINKKMTT